MLNRSLRAFATRLLTPLARWFLKLGISPDIVTIVGTSGVCFAALLIYPRHQFFWGSLVIAIFALSDSLDGVMARVSGRSTKLGAYLASPLDRVAERTI